ncbi:MAG: hypothetical protein R3Y06_11935 [Faecalibacterium sp.]
MKKSLRIGTQNQKSIAIIQATLEKRKTAWQSTTKKKTKKQPKSKNKSPHSI